MSDDLFPVDYTLPTTKRGGHLSDIPEPHVRKWPGPAPREVRIHIRCWAGYAPGARHYHFEVVEEDNPVWDGRPATSWGRPDKPGGWTLPWHDKEGEGRTFRGIALSYNRAVQFAEAVVNKHFAGPGYEVVSDDYQKSIVPSGHRYVYPREGD